MEDYLASRVAFRNVLKDDAENMYREDILYYIAMSSYKYAYLSVPSKQKERYLSFIDDYYNFIGELPDSHYRKELDAIYAKAQKALGKRGVQADDDSSEKDFAKERAKLEKARAKAEKEAAQKVAK
jgi:outer membrane protein assembly factor BamD